MYEPNNNIKYEDWWPSGGPWLDGYKCQVSDLKVEKKVVGKFQDYL